MKNLINTAFLALFIFTTLGCEQQNQVKKPVKKVVESAANNSSKAYFTPYPAGENALPNIDKAPTSIGPKQRRDGPAPASIHEAVQ